MLQHLRISLIAITLYWTVVLSLISIKEITAPIHASVYWVCSKLVLVERSSDYHWRIKFRMKCIKWWGFTVRNDDPGLWHWSVILQRSLSLKINCDETTSTFTVSKILFEGCGGFHRFLYKRYLNYNLYDRCCLW